MLKKLKESYSKIELEDKRNELNKEILSLLMLTNAEDNFYNYVRNSGISEDEYLTETYVQVIELRKKIIEIMRK
jgi:hypothetical protein